jgi:hypothetical protein
LSTTIAYLDPAVGVALADLLTELLEGVEAARGEGEVISPCGQHDRERGRYWSWHQ